jgi:hypothetical protein
MTLAFHGPSGSFERRWIVYAMLRDNVQHHLERGTRGTEFAHLHALGDALVRGEVSVPASELRRELERVGDMLRLPIEELAVSVRTRSIQMLRFPVLTEGETVLAADIGWEAPFPLADALTLDDAFGSLVAELLRVTESATPSAVVTVVDT